MGYAAYHIACSFAMIWGEYIRGAFDLYRLDLLKQLSVYVGPQPLTPEQERVIW